jgi:PIN domain nuclease of toxin-antitoxin system
VIVLDTHAWIWWVSGSPELGDGARQVLDEAEEIGIPGISCWEVAMLVAGGQLTLDRPTLTWLRQALSLPNVQLMPLTPEVAAESAAMEGKLHGDPADRLIVASALRAGARLVTRDERIRASGLVATVW